MVKADMHTHCEASEDSDTLIVDLLESARQKQLTAVAVTDHVEVVDYQKGAYDVAYAQAWDIMKTAKPIEGVRLLLGIELGEPCFDTSLSESLLAGHTYDFVLASQHRLSNKKQDYYFIDYSSWSCSDIVREIQDYFDEVLCVVKWNNFDSLAHLTYPFRYLPDCWRNGDYSPWQETIDSILSILAKNGKALEINTSGIRKGQGMTSPDFPIIKRFYDLGGRYITIGSDAHLAEDVGADLDVAAQLAFQAGFREYTIYIERKPITIPIDIL